MLPAQVSYWTLRENERHNREVERLTGIELEEKKRHNLADERVRVGTLSETTRNNLYQNRQGDYSLGLNAADTATRRFSAVNQAEIGIANARAAAMQAKASMAQAGAANVQAAAAMLNAGTNATVGQSTARLNDTKATQAKLTGVTERERNQAQAQAYRAQSDNSRAQAGKTRAETQYVDFYAGDRATQTDIQRQRAYNEQFGKILDNMTPWF